MYDLEVARAKTDVSAIEPLIPVPKGATRDPNQKRDVSRPADL